MTIEPDSTRATTSPQGSRAGGPYLARGIVTGLLAAAAALGAAQLVAGITGPEGSPVLAVGRAMIDVTPRPVTDFVIKIFGPHDKVVLLTTIVVLLAVFAAAFGVATMRKPAAGFAGLAIFAAIALLAVVTRPDFTAAYVIPTLAGAAVGAYALAWLARAAQADRPAWAGLTGVAGGTALADRPAAGDRPAVGNQRAAGERPAESDWPAVADRPTIGGWHPEAEWHVAADRAAQARDTETGEDTSAPSYGRRGFIAAGAVVAAGAAACGVVGNLLSQHATVTSARALVKIPPPATPLPPLAPGTDLHIPGLSPFVTPAGSFYRVDTALFIPQVPPSSWRLRVHGMVKRELDITFDDLLRRPLTEADITLCCVSNPVGGPYISNTRWLGVPLASLLRQAGIRPGADQLLSTSIDGYTSGTPVASVMDGRNALLAVAMNGVPLPVAHGFPARMVTAGLYGYVSATKWVTDIKITTFAAEQGYWVQQGWAERGPVKTESRIDVPSGNATLKPGRIAVAGVAWAPRRGVAAVEVRVDGGPWQEARLATAAGIDTWRQWVWDWEATAGTHQLQVRATDETGYTQTPAQAEPYPDGATGWHTVQVSVSD